MLKTPHPGSKPTFDINCKLVSQIWLVDWNVVPGSTNHVEEQSCSPLGLYWQY